MAEEEVKEVVETKADVTPEVAAQPAEEAPAPKKAAAEKKAEPKEGAEAEETTAAAPVARRSRGKGISPLGMVHIRATFNNTMVSITDMKGNVVSWSTGGRCGFKGSRKSTAFAATTVAQEAARSAVSQGMHEVEVRVQGPGAGRESAVRALQAAGLTVTAIRDCTPIPHNGCRPRKRRRV